MMDKNVVRISVVFFYIFMTFWCANVCGVAYDERIFNDFIVTYGKSYKNGSAEYEERFKNFQESLVRHRRLNSHRAHPNDAIYGVTKYADLTPEEFGASLLGRRVARPATQVRGPLNLNFGEVVTNFDASWYGDTLPQHYDLRDKKPSVVTAVKNQGTCGACWAFAIVECLETQHALMKTHTLYDLSTQQLVDCSKSTGDMGCNGGYLCNTLAWLQESQEKIELEKEYPYQQKKGNSCLYDKSEGLVNQKNYTCKRYTNEDDMVTLVYNHGPLLAGVDATSFQDYMGGIIQHHCTDKYDNHAVQIVGYDKTGDVPYYIIRNSWGPDWGLAGYLHIKIGGNLCGIANTVGSVDTN